MQRLLEGAQVVDKDQGLRGWGVPSNRWGVCVPGACSASTERLLSDVTGGCWLLFPGKKDSWLC